MDFTIETYRTLINALIKQGFSFQTFAEFIEKKEKRAIVLRHDVDRLPENSLKFARIQAEKGIKGTYYFRIVTESFNEKIIKEIYSLGHEVGYHYEDFVFARQKAKGKRQKGAERKEFARGTNLARNQIAGVARSERKKEENHEDYKRYLTGIAIESFKENLEKLRKIVPVKTICMHGSPMSRWDSRLLWKYYDYHDFGIVGEPYFDVNFDEVFYLTDTGRRWDGDSFSIRDKAVGNRRRAAGEENNKRVGEEKKGRKGEKEKRYLSSDGLEKDISAAPPLHVSPSFHSTLDINKAADEGRLPDKIMMTFHPQRWTSRPIPWIRELIWQNTKNVGKYFLIKMRSQDNKIRR